MLLRGLRHFWCLTLGGLFAAVGIWIDKWVVWAGPAGRVDETGLVHAPLYDGAMFISALAIIPALALFVTHIETTFFQKYVAYYKAINDHATLQQIEDNSRGLEKSTLHSLNSNYCCSSDLKRHSCIVCATYCSGDGFVLSTDRHNQTGRSRGSVPVSVFRLNLFASVLRATRSISLFTGRICCRARHVDRDNVEIR